MSTPEKKKDSNTLKDSIIFNGVLIGAGVGCTLFPPCAAAVGTFATCMGSLPLASYGLPAIIGSVAQGVVAGVAAPVTASSMVVSTAATVGIIGTSLGVAQLVPEDKK